MFERFFQKTSNQKAFFLFSILLNLILAILVFATINEKQIYTYFNSDTLYIPSIYKDLFIDKTGLKGWHLNGAPNFLPDMLLFFIIRSSFDHFIPACFAFSLIQLSLVLFLLSATFKTIFKSISYHHLTFGVLLMTSFLLVTLFNNDFVYTFYILSISYHLGVFIMLLVSIIILFKYLKSGNLKLLYTLFTISVLAIINDRLYVMFFSIPLLSLLALLFIKIENKRRFINVLISNAISILMGLFLFRMLSLSGYIHIISLSWKVFSFNNIIPSLHIFLEQHIHYIKTLDLRGVITILFLVSLFIHFIFLIRNIKLIANKKVFNQNEFIYLLLFISVQISILLTPIINGNYVSWAILRYNIYSLYIGVFSYAYLIYKLCTWRVQSVKYSYLLISILIAANSVIIVSKYIKSDISVGIKNFLSYYPETVQCMDQLAAENNLRFGIAEYWSAKYITMFSKEDIRVYTVLDNLSIWCHVTNENWYYKNDKGKYGNPEFNFVISNEIKYDNILEHLGAPIDTLNCINKEILLFDTFQFDNKNRKPYIMH